jgi:hypothetical protein
VDPVEAFLRSKGVQFHLGHRLVAVEGACRRVTALRFSNGERFALRDTDTVAMTVSDQETANLAGVDVRWSVGDADEMTCYVAITDQGTAQRLRDTRVLDASGCHMFSVFDHAWMIGAGIDEVHTHGYEMLLFVPVLNMRAKSSVSGRAVFECTEEQFTGELLAILGLDPTRAKVLLDPREPSLAEDVHSLWRTKASNHHGNSNRLAHPVSSTWSNLFGRM